MSAADLLREFQKFISSGLLALYSSKTYKGRNTGVNLSNLFLGKWVSVALKQKRYKKEISGNIVTMIELHKSKGGRSGLVGIFESYFKENKTHTIFSQEYSKSDFERIELVKADLKNQLWAVNVPLDYDPTVNGAYQPKEEKDIFSFEMDWSNSFCKSGALSKPLRLYSTEVLQEIVDAFYEHGFYVLVQNKAQSENKNSELIWHYSFDIYPNDKPENGIEIPSKYH